MPWSARARRRTAIASCAIAVVAGVIVRTTYALGHHHPRHYAISDAAQYLEMAQRWLDPGPRPNIGDTIWPPGTAALWALLSAFDPSLGLAALANLLASLAVMWLTAASAARLAGKQSGFIALAIAALHLGFIHYTGFFLAEQPFQLCVALALCLSLGAIAGLDPARARASGFLPGAVAGAAFGLCALFRPNALPVFGAGSLALGVHYLRRRERAALYLGAGLALGLGLVVAAAAQRCTLAAGTRVCLFSNNIAMNMALGQAGEVYGLEFRAPGSAQDATAWVPPSLIHHGYQGMGQVPATIFDTAGVMRYLGQRFRADPLLFLVRALGNALDLFELPTWPDDYGALASRAATVWKQLFFAAVLVPAAVGAWRLMRGAVLGSRMRPEAVFVAGALVGLPLSAAISLGEARYRIPFDGILIALASAVYAGVTDWSERAPDPRAGGYATRRWLASGLGLASVLFVLVATAHPGLRLGAVLRASVERDAPPSRSERAELTRFAAARVEGALWNMPGNHVFRCTPACPELRFELPASTRARMLSLSVDHNDRYRVRFYRDRALLAHADLAPDPQSAGLHNWLIAVPAAALARFDAVSVQPLYGDGHYSLGHLVLVP